MWYGGKLCSHQQVKNHSLFGCCFCLFALCSVCLFLCSGSEVFQEGNYGVIRGQEVSYFLSGSLFSVFINYC